MVAAVTIERPSGSGDADSKGCYGVNAQEPDCLRSKTESPPLRFAPRVRPLLVTRSGLALDDVVDLEHLGLPRLDPDLVQHRHEALTERVELLARVPDLTDAEVAVRLEGDVVVESLRRPVAHLLQTADGVVVLLGRHAGRGREASEDPRLAGVHGRGRNSGGHSWPPSCGCSRPSRPTTERVLRSPGGRGV